MAKRVAPTPVCQKAEEDESNADASLLLHLVADKNQHLKVKISVLKNPDFHHVCNLHANLYILLHSIDCVDSLM